MRITHTDGPLKNKTYDYAPTATVHTTLTGIYTIQNNTSTWIPRGRGGKIATTKATKKSTGNGFSPPE